MLIPVLYPMVCELFKILTRRHRERKEIQKASAMVFTYTMPILT